MSAMPLAPDPSPADLVVSVAWQLLKDAGRDSTPLDWSAALEGACDVLYDIEVLEKPLEVAA